VHQAKNPSCGPRFRIDGTCGKQCESEGYSGWICHDNCTCLICPYIDREQRLENEKIQKQGACLLQLCLSTSNKTESWILFIYKNLARNLYTPHVLFYRSVNWPGVSQPGPGEYTIISKHHKRTCKQVLQVKLHLHINLVSP
jgi:hypothetical protein